MSDIDHLKSVVHRRGPLTKKDYGDAIGDLKRARMQDRVAHICCSVCEDTGHTAETCHHNPLVLARKWSEATSVWCCYHCGFVATNDDEARDHFGFNEQVRAKCLREQRAEIECLRELNSAIDDYWNARTDANVKLVCYWQFKAKEALSEAANSDCLSVVPER